MELSWFRNKLRQIKDFINEFHPVCIAFQETYLKPGDEAKIKRHSLVRRDCNSGRASGGVALLVSHDHPSSIIPLHTNLQVVAVRIAVPRLVTVCSLYLPPNATIDRHDLDRLVTELPTPFIIIGDFNGHNPRERQIEEFISDHSLCLLNNGECSIVCYKKCSFFPSAFPWSKIVQCLRTGGQLKVTFSPHYERGSGQRIDTTSKRNNFPTFFIIQRILNINETFHGVSPFLVEKALTSSIGDAKSTKKLRSGDLLVEVESPKQAKEITKLKSLSTIPVSVKPHATLNSSRGVISCGELLNEPEEKITEELKSQGVMHVRRITIRREGQLLNTKHLILTFDSNKLPEYIKAGYMRLSVRTYIPNPLRCFKCQRFGHSKTSCRGTLTCARCAEVGHESTDCTRTEKNKDISTVSISKPSDSTKRASPPITNTLISSSPSVAPVSEAALASPDFTDFKPVSNRKKLKKNSPNKTNNTIVEKIPRIYTTSHLEVPNSITTKDNISTHQSTLKPSVIAKPTSVDIQLLPMAVLPPLEKILLQSRESDADAEMSSSSASEEDALEYNMSEDLEDSPAVISPPPPSKPEKANKYKNR
ncbi:hypothetical protein AVEN_154753-1 [Araneus ventricosus]|uniref:CCHC-type domain-containing protein n=1 Tax=Araneus ventricosus TaxID=182803 RepID=A0A4Y2BV46_ARAVE|nr:hypothetical protein AVEN_154753-1 [Araneus ventricosus]